MSQRESAADLLKITQIEVALQQNEIEKFKEIYNAAKVIRTELEKNEQMEIFRIIF